MMVLQQLDAPQASREQLLRVHSAEHIDRVFDAAPAEDLAWLDGDTAMNPFTLEAALYAAGANVLAVDLVMNGRASQAFCAVRPPGHHAERNKVMGFCFFNNIAVGAAHAIAEHGLERVAIIDFDVHHGNGTEDIFAGNEKVLFCSTFQHPYYPNSGYDTQNAQYHQRAIAGGNRWRHLSGSGFSPLDAGAGCLRATANHDIRRL